MKFIGSIKHKIKFIFSTVDFTMHKRSLTNLAKLSKKEVRSFIDSFDVLLSDCDGVLWLENTAYEGSAQFINLMRDLGKKIFFVTNNSTKHRDEFLEKARKLGFICDKVNKLVNQIST